jgi:DNA-binding transcriptional LysR family regulator
MSNIRFLRTLIAIGRYGSFSAASERVALTQAAVSMQMQALEAEWKQVLFDRSGRNTVLNSTGRAILPRVEQIIALYDEMRAIGISASEMVGKVTIGSVVSSMGLLAAVVAGLKSTHPRLAVRLITARSLDLAAQVGSGEIDAALLVESTGKVPANMRWTPLYAEPLVLAASKMTGDASAGKLLRARPFLQFDRTQRTGVLIDRALRKNKIAADPFLELSSLEAIIELVRQDIGVAIVPMVRRSMWRSDAALRILPLSPTAPQRIVGLLERRENDPLQIISVIRQRIQEGSVEP